MVKLAFLMLHTPQLTQPFAVATFVMCGRPAAVAASFGVSTTSLPAQQQQDSHATQNQQQLTAAFTWVPKSIG